MTAISRIVIVSDFCAPVPPAGSAWTAQDFAAAWRRAPDAAAPPPAPAPAPAPVTGGYLERLPLACVAAGLVREAEIWSFAGADDAPFDSRRLREGGGTGDGEGEGRPRRRVFRADGHPAPYGSADILAHVARFGPPEILCIWGLGVDAAVLEACRDSILIYNSIDAPAIRVPPDLSARFDIFLTGADWQSEEIRARHPDALCAVLPVGPEFASDLTFFPTGAAKDYDVVYVAATQPYKRHDLLLDALSPGMRALCVVGYGHMTEDLAAEARRRGLAVDWVGPVPHDEVNRLINRARVGVVCGVEDGAPAILTEYMLAGLPVLANDRLVCGLQYIRPDTGLAAPEAAFGAALRELVARSADYAPRRVVQENWTWPHSVRRLAALIATARARRGRAA